MSEVIRAEAETLFSVQLKMKIHLLMLLLFLMKFSNLGLTKVETKPNIIAQETEKELPELTQVAKTGLPEPAQGTQ